MASKEFEKFLANASDEQKKNITDLGKTVDSKIESTVKPATTVDLAPSATPNDKLGYGDSVKTVAPTDKAAETAAPAKGNSTTMNEALTKPTTETTPPQQTDTNKLTT